VVTRTVTIYEVPNSYASSGGTVNISSTSTMVISDDDASMQATDLLDPGAAQTFLVDGGSIDSYDFLYDDTVTINGNTYAVKTFQLVINGVTHTYVMSADNDLLTGVSSGDTLSLVTYANYTDLNYTSLPCFTRGTLILTAAGEIAIEDLKVGDLIHTRDRGLQPIRWIGSSTLNHRQLLVQQHLLPIRIRAHTFGRDLPARDLVVSPQHRIVLEGWEIELQFGMEEVLASAKSLLGKGAIETAFDCQHVEYFHMMFDQHEIVTSEGLSTESFLVGDTIRDTMDVAQLHEILELFPELADNDEAMNSVPVRPISRTYEVRSLQSIAA